MDIIWVNFITTSTNDRALDEDWFSQGKSSPKLWPQDLGECNLPRYLWISFFHHGYVRICFNQNYLSDIHIRIIWICLLRIIWICLWCMILGTVYPDPDRCR